MHQRFDARQLLAELSARMKTGKVFFLEAAPFGQRHRQRIAERQHCRRGRSRRESERASLFRHRAVEHDVSSLRQRGKLTAVAGKHGIACHRDQLHFQPLDRRQQRKQFFGLATVRKCDHHVAARDHAEIAVNCFCRMQKQRRRSRRTESRCDLARDQSALAHSGDDDARAAAAIQQFDGLPKRPAPSDQQCGPQAHGELLPQLEQH